MLRFPASHFSSAVFRYVGPTACWPALADTNRNAFYAPTVSTGRPSLLLSRIAQQGMMIVIAVMRQRWVGARFSETVVSAISNGNGSRT